MNHRVILVAESQVQSEGQVLRGIRPARSLAEIGPPVPDDALSLKIRSGIGLVVDEVVIGRVA